MIGYSNFELSDIAGLSLLAGQASASRSGGTFQRKQGKELYIIVYHVQNYNNKKCMYKTNRTTIKLTYESWLYCTLTAEDVSDMNCLQLVLSQLVAHPYLFMCGLEI